VCGFCSGPGTSGVHRRQVLAAQTGPRDCLSSWAEDADDRASMGCRPCDDKGSSWHKAVVTVPLVMSVVEDEQTSEIRCSSLLQPELGPGWWSIPWREEDADRWASFTRRKLELNPKSPLSRLHERKFRAHCPLSRTELTWRWRLAMSAFDAVDGAHS
jgi:hypothetical protein